jgi:hypothetical protein
MIVDTSQKEKTIVKKDVGLLDLRKRPEKANMNVMRPKEMGTRARMAITRGWLENTGFRF